MQPISNHILITPDKEKTAVTTESGHQIHMGINYAYNPEYKRTINKWNTLEHAIITGTVLEVPEVMSSNEVETVIDIKKGDRVWYHYFGEVDAVNEGRFDENGNLFINVETLYGIKRGDDIIPVNGFIYVEAVQPEPPKTTLIVPDTALPPVSQNYGIVRFVGNPVTKYKGFDDYGGDTNEISVGDHVYFHDSNAIKVEQALHETIMPGKVLYRMRRLDVEMCHPELDTYIMHDSTPTSYTLIKNQWRPVNNRTLIKIDPPSDKIGSFIANDNYKQLPSTGTVVSIGAKVETIKVGDHVQWHVGHGREFRHDDVDYRIVVEQDIILVNSKVVAL